MRPSGGGTVWGMVVGYLGGTALLVCGVVAIPHNQIVGGVLTVLALLGFLVGDISRRLARLR